MWDPGDSEVAPVLRVRPQEKCHYLTSMRSFVQNTHMLVFTPKHRQPILEKAGRARLKAYAKGFFKNKDCELLAMDGAEDHLHFVFFKHPSYAESDLVRDLKRSLHNFIDSAQLFPLFANWQLKYSMFTYSYWDRPMIIAYVENQEAHHEHQREEYLIELKQLYEAHGLEFKEDYLE